MQNLSSTPAPRKPRGKPFLKGHDDRRHKFTKEECSRGFWAAIAIMGISIGEKLHANGRWPNYQGRRAA